MGELNETVTSLFSGNSSEIMTYFEGKTQN